MLSVQRSTDMQDPNADKGPYRVGADGCYTDMLLRGSADAGIPSETDSALDHYWQGHVDARSEAAALIDQSLRILHMTTAFARIVQAGDGVRIADQLPHARLMTTVLEEQNRLNATLTQATMRTAPSSAAMRCMRPGGRAPMIIVVHPIPWVTRLLRADEGAAILTLIDPTRRPAAVAPLLRDAFDLTPCETELTILLAAGHSLESAAVIRDCRPATLRVHLRRIFIKTGTSRQADLVALLMRVGCK